MSTLDGLVAARLFLEHANTLRCNNGELLSRLRRATKRDPHTTPADSDQDKKHLLPTEEKLRHAFPDTREVQELLCCTCYLCGDTSNLMPMLHDRGVLQHYEKLKGLAVLILSGCLFALKELCERVDDGVPFKFAIGVPRAYFSRLGVAPDRCSHRRQDEYGSLRSIADLCLNCRAKAFRGAVVEKQKVVDIFRVQRTRIIYERSSVNMPYIDEHPLAMAYERLTPKFVTSMLEPSYIHPNDLDLKDRILFRKVYQYRHSEVEESEQARKEAEIAIHLSQRKANSVAEVLFAFTHQDQDHSFVEVVSPRYDGDLEGLFTNPHGFQERADMESPLQHELWKAAIDVVGAVATMHDAIDKRDIDCLGHFDIRPANILLDKSHPELKMLLTDFGQAAAKRPGANDYAPPEMSVLRSGRDPLKAKYDVWSMGRLLLEMLIFIKAGSQGLQTFRGDLRRQDDGDTSLWQGNRAENIVLRQSVANSIRALEDRSDLQTQSVVARIRSMLSIFPEQRPDMRSCFSHFARKTFGREAQGMPGQDLLKSRLHEWKTSYSTGEFIKPLPANMFVYRKKLDLVRRGYEDDITLQIEEVNDDTKPCRSVSFVPLAFYDSTSQPSELLKCRFEQLQTAFTFHFMYLAEYLKFMELMTYQRIMPDFRRDPTTGTRIKIRSLLIKEHGMLLDKTREYTGGKLQIWKQLTEEEYAACYGRPLRPESSGLPFDSSSQFDSSSHTSQSAMSFPKRLPIGHQVNLWKMALWSREAPSGTPVCLVIDIGTKTWRLEVPAGNDATCLKIKPHYSHKEFPGARFVPPDPAGGSDGATKPCPGIPIEPTRLASEMQLRIKSAKITFESPQDRQSVIQILQDNHFHLPGSI